MISQEHKNKVLSYYAKARELGATVVTGGGAAQMPGVMAKAPGCSRRFGPDWTTIPRLRAKRSSAPVP
ncbi:MAG: hypothetical protein R3E34_13735 [Rhodocyclaceae bacterium]